MGNVISAGGSILGGFQQKAALDNQADFAKIQGDIAMRNAQINASEIRRRGKKLISKQVVGFAKAGVELASGTPVEVFAETASDTELEALTMVHSGVLQQFGFETTASNKEQEGKDALLSGFIDAGSKMIPSMPGTSA